MDNKEIKKDFTKSAEGKVALSAEDKARIEAKVKAKLDEEAKKEAEKKYEDELLRAAKAAKFAGKAPSTQPAPGLMAIHIDLPTFCNKITLDGIAYWHNFTYHVTPEVFESLSEVMHRAKLHDEEVAGRRNSNQYRPKRNSLASM